MVKKFEIAICVTKSGRNLQAILDAIEVEEIKGVEITGVIAMRRGIKAIEIAEEAGIPVTILAESEYSSKRAYASDFLSALYENDPDLLVMADSSMKVPKEVRKEFTKPIINIHPSLIPAFWEKDLYGLDLHKAVLNRGVKLTGATVYIDNGTMDVPIIGQLGVHVFPGDTAENLQIRVFDNADSKILPWTINSFANGKITYNDGKLRIYAPCPY